MSLLNKIKIKLKVGIQSLASHTSLIVYLSSQTLSYLLYQMEIFIHLAHTLLRASIV